MKFKRDGSVHDVIDISDDDTSLSTDRHFSKIGRKLVSVQQKTSLPNRRGLIQAETDRELRVSPARYSQEALQKWAKHFPVKSTNKDLAI